MRPSLATRGVISVRPPRSRIPSRVEGGSAHGRAREAAGATALLLTLTKHGSYLNVLAVAEPPLVVLATCSAWWVLGARGRGEPGARERSTTTSVARAPALVRVAVVLAVALLLAQSASLLLSPAHPALFARPLSDASHGRALSSEGVRVAARRVAICPVWTPSRPNPFFAFAAGRPMPGGQPDRFIVRHAHVHAAVRRRALASPAPAAACAPRGPGRIARATVR